MAVSVFDILELFASSMVHLIFGSYIFCKAVTMDVSQALSGCFKLKNVFNLLKKVVDEDERKDLVLEGSPPPIVLVHGIFGFGKGRLGGLSYFGGAEKRDERVLVPDLGSLSSVHDRARQLFYYLKGGQVDYGEKRSKIYGHSRFGNTYDQGHYPSWSKDHPIHFVAHSAGVQVVRILHQMLADKAFIGYDTCEDWVLSVTALSGAINGTTRCYYDGMQPGDGKSMKPVSLLQLCRIGVILYDWMDIGWFKNYYNFGFDHFEMSWRKRGIRGLLDLLLGKSGPFASGDWILPDLTIQGSMKLNARLQTFPRTFYFSYATKRTKKFLGITIPSSVFGIHFMLFIRVLQMCQWRHPFNIPPPYKGYRDEDWEDNDGAVNTVSMTHPRLPVEHPSHFVAKDSDCHPLQPGVWYYKILEADHIFFIVNRERAGVQFDILYDSIFQRCRKHAFRTLPPVLPNDSKQ